MSEEAALEDVKLTTEDDIAQENRWRSKMLKRLGKQFEELHERFDEEVTERKSLEESLRRAGAAAGEIRWRSEETQGAEQVGHGEAVRRTGRMWRRLSLG